MIAGGILAYWGTIFVWLPVGLLMSCLLVRDLTTGERTELSTVQRILAACRRRELFSLLLPVLAALLSALLHDNDARDRGIAANRRTGERDQRELFQRVGRGGAPDSDVSARLEDILAVAAVYVFPPALCSGLWTWVMRRSGYAVFHRAWLDTAAALLATLAPLSFLLVAFDLSRLMAWAYLAFIVVARVLVDMGASDRPPPAPLWPATLAPLVTAALFWTGPTIYAWADMSHLIRCERFCFKEQTPQGRAIDLFRRSAIATPIWEYSAPAGLLRGSTGHNERDGTGEACAGWHAPDAIRPG